ncbi:MAG: class I SAM-dependent methyltransferase [Nitrososphaeraceae archaeon]
MSSNINFKTKTKMTYNCASDHYDDSPLSFWNYHSNKTIQYLHLQKGFTVLDLGCGSGASAIVSAKKVGNSGKVIGIDIAEKMLDLARKKAEDNNLVNIEFINRDMTNLDYFFDNQFDVVVCIFAIFFVENMKRFLKEMWRLVKPGGKLSITTWGPRMFEPAYSHWNNILKKYRPDILSSYNPWDKTNSTDSLGRLFEESNVTNVNIKEEMTYQPLSNPVDWWTIALGSGLRSVINQLSQDEYVKIKEANIDLIKKNKIKNIETNALYAISKK